MTTAPNPTVRGTRTRRPRDAGLTLAELLTAMLLFGVLSTLLLGFAVSVSRASEKITSSADVTEESRLAIERMNREFRQATRVRSATLVEAGDDQTAVTIEVDFNGNGFIDESAADPEVLTYRWDPDTANLTLSANDEAGDAVAQPVLAGGVTEFEVRLRSSRWDYDKTGRTLASGAQAPDGVTTWQELDDSTVVGNNNDRPDAAELDLLDLVSIRLTVVENDRERTFTIQADMRNSEQEPVTS